MVHAATDWANDGLFGDGFHLFGIGTSAYEEVEEEYGDSDEIIAAYVESLGSKGEAIADAIDTEADDYDSEEAVKALTSLKAMVKSADTVDYTVEDEETLETTVDTADADAIKEAIDLAIQYDGAAPDPADYGVWVPGIPVLIEDGLDAIGCADWLKGLILDGIVAGVGAVLGFVPQMLVLFLFLAIPWRHADTWHVSHSLWIEFSEDLVFQESHSFQCLSVQVVVFRVSWLHVQSRTKETVV